MERLKALKKTGVEEGNNNRKCFSLSVQRDYRKRYSAKRERKDGREEREMGGNEKRP